MTMSQYQDATTDGTASIESKPDQPTNETKADWALDVGPYRLRYLRSKENSFGHEESEPGTDEQVTSTTIFEMAWVYANQRKSAWRLVIGARSFWIFF